MPEMAQNEPERMIVTRVVSASRELVWKAWTDPKYAKQWWGPQGFTTPVYEIDLRVGGKFRYCMRAPDGQEFWSCGEYHQIIPLERIVLSMYFCDPDGNRVEPEHYGIKHEAIDGAHDIITFEDVGNGQTRVTFAGNETMENAASSGQLEGMNQVVDKFVALVAELKRAE